MPIYDITVTINDTVPIYKGDPSVNFTTFKAIERGDSANVSQISLGVHTATHVDAPNHFIDGAKRVHELDPAKLVGPCRVIEVPDDVTAIEPENCGDLAGVEARVDVGCRQAELQAAARDQLRLELVYRGAAAIHRRVHDLTWTEIAQTGGAAHGRA